MVDCCEVVVPSPTSDAGLIPMFLPDYQPVGHTDLRAPFERLWHQEIDPVRGLKVVEIMNSLVVPGPPGP